MYNTKHKQDKPNSQQALKQTRRTQIQESTDSSQEEELYTLFNIPKFNRSSRPRDRLQPKQRRAKSATHSSTNNNTRTSTRVPAGLPSNFGTTVSKRPSKPSSKRVLQSTLSLSQPLDEKEKNKRDEVLTIARRKLDYSWKTPLKRHPKNPNTGEEIHTRFSVTPEHKDTSYITQSPVDSGWGIEEKERLNTTTKLHWGATHPKSREEERKQRESRANSRYERIRKHQQMIQESIQHEEANLKVQLDRRLKSVAQQQNNYEELIAQRNARGGAF